MSNPKNILGVSNSQHGKSWVQRLINDILELPVEQMICSEGTVYGLRYHTVEPIGGSWMDMEAWCFDTFGETSSIWQETKNLTPAPHKRWYMNNRKFWFCNEADRTMFILKWR